MLNTKGEVAECTGDNIFVVMGGVLKTPPIDAGILAGVTRSADIELAHAANIPVIQPDPVSCHKAAMMPSASAIRSGAITMCAGSNHDR